MNAGRFARGVVVDTSAAFAILTSEPAAELGRSAIAGSPRSLMSAASLAELGVVLSRRFANSTPDLCASFIRTGEIEIVAVDERHAIAAVEAHHRFGAGRHQARLNFGDCFTYATARIAGLPVLCVGDAFAQTDIGVVRIDA